MSGVKRAPQDGSVERNERRAKRSGANDELCVVGGEPAFQRGVQDLAAVNGMNAAAQRRKSGARARDPAKVCVPA